MLNVVKFSRYSLEEKYPLSRVSIAFNTYSEYWRKLPYSTFLKIELLKYSLPPWPEYPITIFPQSAASSGGNPNPSKSENERKIGLSLIEILENWTQLFENFIGTPKFNKNLILLYLRDMTGLTTKEIRNAMRHFKCLYYLFKDNYIT